jgi:hypothetical protein
MGRDEVTYADGSGVCGVTLKGGTLEVSSQGGLFGGEATVETTNPGAAGSPDPDETVEGWDRVFAITQGREVINPRPIDQAIIFRHTAGDAASLFDAVKGKIQGGEAA